MIVKTLILLISTYCFVSGSYYDSDDEYKASDSSEENISTTPVVPVTVKKAVTSDEESYFYNSDSSEETISTTPKVTKNNDRINWLDGDNGQVKWATHCNIDGNVIGTKQIRSEDCGSVCIARSDCITFSWSYDEGGTCYLKDGGVARYAGDTPVCGKVLNRDTKSNDNDQQPKTGRDNANDADVDDANDTDVDDIKWLEKCAYPPHTKGKTVTSSGLLGPVAVLYDLALASADRIIAGIERFNTCPAANECKFNITHRGQIGTNGFNSEWFTMDGDVNSNDEHLDGLGHQVDTGSEKIHGRLSSIRFTPYGGSCVKAITIACGYEVVPGNAYIKITYKHMGAAFKPHGFRRIEMYTDNDCVRFDDRRWGNSFQKINIDPSIFDCRKNDQKCITSHLEIS